MIPRRVLLTCLALAVVGRVFTFGAGLAAVNTVGFASAFAPPPDDFQHHA